MPDGMASGSRVLRASGPLLHGVRSASLAELSAENLGLLSVDGNMSSDFCELESGCSRKESSRCPDRDDDDRLDDDHGRPRSLLFLEIDELQSSPTLEPERCLRCPAPPMRP